MNKGILGLAISMLAALPAVAQAADFASIACIEQQVPPMVGKRFGDATIGEAQAQAQGKTFQAPDLQKDVDALANIAAKCRLQHGWSDAALEAAIGYSVARMSVSGARMLLANNKIDPAIVERVHGALPLHHRVAFALDAVPNEAVDALVDTIVERGIALETQEAGIYVGTMAGLLAVAEVDLDRFVKN